jgi:hypothetical protein
MGERRAIHHQYSGRRSRRCITGAGLAAAIASAGVAGSGVAANAPHGIRNSQSIRFFGARVAEFAAK